MSAFKETYWSMTKPQPSTGPVYNTFSQNDSPITCPSTGQCDVTSHMAWNIRQSFPSLENLCGKLDTDGM